MCTTWSRARRLLRTPITFHRADRVSILQQQDLDALQLLARVHESILEHITNIHKSILVLTPSNSGLLRSSMGNMFFFASHVAVFRAQFKAQQWLWPLRTVKGW